MRARPLTVFTCMVVSLSSHKKLPMEIQPFLDCELELKAQLKVTSQLDVRQRKQGHPTKKGIVRRRTAETKEFLQLLPINLPRLCG